MLQGQPDARSLALTRPPLLFELVQDDAEVASMKLGGGTIGQLSLNLQAAPHGPVLFTPVRVGVELVVRTRGVDFDEVLGEGFGLLEGLILLWRPRQIPDTGVDHELERLQDRCIARHPFIELFQGAQE